MLFLLPPVDHSLSSRSRSFSSQNIDKKRWQSHRPRDAGLVYCSGRVLYVHFTSSACGQLQHVRLVLRPRCSVDGLPALRITPCLIFCDRLRSSRILTQQAYLYPVSIHSALSRWRKLSAIRLSGFLCLQLVSTTFPYSSGRSHSLSLPPISLPISSPEHCIWRTPGARSLHVRRIRTADIHSRHPPS